MEPAVTLIEYLGGPKTLASALGKDLSRVYRWTYPREKGGTDGLIPSREQRRLLDYARDNAIDLQPGDFFSSDRVRAKLDTQKTREAAE